ncbi:unnamed protein product [Fraxinus pennsylvanica]|uniref:Uncharacterized protein n=1 Tax=Fraxinus pennsylvanica TaxID=56036 RepID=A0AAD2A8Z3_9LAMI|nr:unnamed protein product [Fraxinus pennsylvanica]
MAMSLRWPTIRHKTSSIDTSCCKRQHRDIVYVVRDGAAFGTSENALRAYVASKRAVVGLTKNLCIELGQHRMRMNCISPLLWLPSIHEDSRTNQFKFSKSKSPLPIYLEQLRRRRAEHEQRPVPFLLLWIGCGLSLIFSGWTSTVRQFPIPGPKEVEGATDPIEAEEEE